MEGGEGGREERKKGRKKGERKKKKEKAKEKKHKRPFKKILSSGILQVQKKKKQVFPRKSDEVQLAKSRHPYCSHSPKTDPFL